MFVIGGEQPEDVQAQLAVAVAAATALRAVSTGSEILQFADDHGRVQLEVRLRAEPYWTIVSVARGDRSIEPHLAQAVGGVFAPAPVGAQLRVVSEPAAEAPASATTPIPLVAGPEPDPSETVRAPVVRFALQVSDGSEVVLRGRVLLGRDPQPTRSADTDAALVRVMDPDRGVSKTHLRVDVRGGEVWVEDLASTNGTELAGSDETFALLEPGVPTPIRPGNRLRFGSLQAELVRR